MLRPGGRGDEQARPETGCRVVQDTKNFASQQFCAAPPPNCFQAAIQAVAAVGSLERLSCEIDMQSQRCGIVNSEICFKALHVNFFAGSGSK